MLIRKQKPDSEFFLNFDDGDEVEFSELLFLLLCCMLFSLTADHQIFYISCPTLKSCLTLSESNDINHFTFFFEINLVRIKFDKIWSIFVYKLRIDHEILVDICGLRFRSFHPISMILPFYRHLLLINYDEVGPVDRNRTTE